MWKELRVLGDLELRIALCVEDMGGEAILSQADIVRECNVDKSKIARRINSLDFKGLLKVTPTVDGKYKFKLIIEKNKTYKNTVQMK